MKIIVCLIAIVIMLIILSILTLAGKVVELKEDLNKCNTDRKELDKRLEAAERSFAFYKTELEKRIAKFNDNAYKYKEEVKSEFESINNAIKSLQNKNQNFAMQPSKVRNDCKANTNDLVVLNNKLTEHLEK